MELNACDSRERVKWSSCTLNISFRSLQLTTCKKTRANHVEGGGGRYITIKTPPKAEKKIEHQRRVLGLHDLRERRVRIDG